MTQLLLIEDDPLLGEGLVDFLSQHGFSIHWSRYSDDVLKFWLGAELVILDRQLADGDSLRHLPQWLALKAQPVIILTARTDINDRIEGLSCGARDYLCKPFAQDELLARIHVQLRPIGTSTIELDAVTIDLGRHCVFSNQAAIELTPKAFKLLAVLAQNPNRLYSREELLNRVWGYQSFPTTRTVDNHILQLRQLFPTLCIETVRGIGYRLKR